MLPLVQKVGFRRARNGILSCLELSADLRGAGGSALLEIVRDMLLDLRVQLVRHQVASETLAELYVVEFDGAALSDERRSRVEQILRALLTRPLHRGLVKTRPRVQSRASDSVAPRR